MVPFGGKLVLVTGASGALGHAMVRTFLALGAQVAAAARRRTMLDDLRVAMGASDRLDTCEADTTDPEGVEALLSALERGTGPVHGVVQCVGSWAGARIAETSDVTWRQLVASNLDSSFWVLRGALRRMIPRRAGRVVLVSSMGALSPDPDAAAYGTVKAALLHLVDAAARETAGTGVTVNVVLPGTMDTAANRKAMPARDPSKWAKTEEVAAAAAFLLSDDAAGVNGARVTVPGTRA